MTRRVCAGMYIRKLTNIGETLVTNVAGNTEGRVVCRKMVCVSVRSFFVLAFGQAPRSGRTVHQGESHSDVLSLSPPFSGTFLARRD